VNDEVPFWEQLIHWWEANKDEPVPERMYEGLQLAKKRQVAFVSRRKYKNVVH
jgi:hypothetical protein